MLTRQTSHSMLFQSKSNELHLPQHMDMSDHLPIFLKCFPRMDRKGTRKKRFQFENMWITESSCNDVVQTAWASVSNPNVVDKLQECIDKCSTKLLEWNAATFGNVRSRIRSLRCNSSPNVMLLAGDLLLDKYGTGAKKKRSFGGNVHDPTTSNMETPTLVGSTLGLTCDVLITGLWASRMMLEIGTLRMTTLLTLLPSISRISFPPPILVE